MTLETLMKPWENVKVCAHRPPPNPVPSHKDKLECSQLGTEPLASHTHSCQACGHQARVKQSP